jgi:hypothetical protein
MGTINQNFIQTLQVEVTNILETIFNFEIAIDLIDIDRLINKNDNIFDL